jgi:hypothetical protein
MIDQQNLVQEKLEFQDYCDNVLREFDKKPFKVSDLKNAIHIDDSYLTTNKPESWDKIRDMHEYFNLQIEPFENQLNKLVKRRNRYARALTGNIIPFIGTIIIGIHLGVSYSSWIIAAILIGIFYILISIALISRAIAIRNLPDKLKNDFIKKINATS